MIEGIERKGIERKRSVSFSGSQGSKQLQMLRDGETILVVEDEEAVRVSIRKILERFGYRVLEAQGGEEAVSICEHSHSPIHLLLTDITMPHISGLELARRLKLSCPQMGVIFMSGNPYLISEQLPDQCDPLLEEDLELLSKPFALDELVYTVRKVLDTQGKEPVV